MPGSPRSGPARGSRHSSPRRRSPAARSVSSRQAAGTADHRLGLSRLERRKIRLELADAAAVAALIDLPQQDGRRYPSRPRRLDALPQVRLEGIQLGGSRATRPITRYRRSARRYLRTVLRETPSSRAIALMLLPWRANTRISTDCWVIIFAVQKTAIIIQGGNFIPASGGHFYTGSDT